MAQMKNISNTIFLDTVSTLFPRKLTFLEESLGSRENKLADSFAIKVLNQLNKNNNFNIVLLDRDMNINRDEAQKIISSYGIDIQLHDKWNVNYANDLQSPFMPISNWLTENKADNYSAFINLKYKFELDFDDNSDVNFNCIHFIDEDNGISLKNFQEIQQSFNLWI